MKSIATQFNLRSKPSMPQCLKKVFYLRHFVYKLCHNVSYNDHDVCNRQDEVFCKDDFCVGKTCHVATVEKKD